MEEKKRVGVRFFFASFFFFLSLIDLLLIRFCFFLKKINKNKKQKLKKKVKVEMRRSALIPI